MNLPQTPTNFFKQLRFILVETSRAGNIGAVARAMKTMGYSDLVLVNPRFADAVQDPEAVAFASGAQDILTAARVVGSMAEALDGINFAAAVSARLREYSPPVLTPRQFAARLVAPVSAVAPVSPLDLLELQAPLTPVSSAPDAALTAVPAGSPTAVPALHAAVIFGNERFGLPNDVVEQCNVLINIPANPDYSSLNLSQAAQVVAYECRMAVLDQAPGEAIVVSVRQPAGDANPIGFHGEAASLAQIEGMYQHLESALVEIGFLDAGNPRKLMPRLKRLFARAQLETEEVNILRGIARHITGRSGGGKQ